MHMLQLLLVACFTVQLYVDRGIISYISCQEYVLLEFTKSFEVYKILWPMLNGAESLCFVWCHNCWLLATAYQNLPIEDE